MNAPVQDSPESVHGTAAPGGALVQQIERGIKPSWVLVCLFVSILVSAIAIGIAMNARDRAGLAERESRLAQEDLIMLRAAVRAHGIPADGAGDHDDP